MFFLIKQNILTIIYLNDYQYDFNNKNFSTWKEIKYLLQIQMFDAMLLDFLFAPDFTHQL